MKKDDQNIQEEHPFILNDGDGPVSFASEAAFSLQSFPKKTRAGKVLPLTGVGNMPENQLTSVEKMELAKEGVEKQGLENLKAVTGLDYDNLAKALSVTRATLINKKGREKFNVSLSERIISMADIYSFGYEVFGNEEKFNGWMFKPNMALGGKKPYDFMDNQFGREEVRNIIGRIAYGVYS